MAVQANTSANMQAVQANTSANMQAVQANAGATMQVDEQAFEEYCSVMDSLRPKYLDRITELLDNPATQRTVTANILAYFRQIQSWLQVRTCWPARCSPWCLMFLSMWLPRMTGEFLCRCV